MAQMRGGDLLIPHERTGQAVKLHPRGDNPKSPRYQRSYNLMNCRVKPDGCLCSTRSDGFIRSSLPHRSRLATPA